MSTIPRILITALALALGAFGLPTPASAAAGFGDVDAGRWYTAPIAWLVAEDITNGTEPGCFSPHDAVTRGQIVTFLYRLDDARGNTPQTSDHPFADVVAGYQQVPVGWAYLNDVTKGTTSPTFAPDIAVTRGDFAALLWRYAGEPVASSPHPFVDVVRGYQQVAVSWMAEEAITTGTTPTTFDPDGAMTRAEAATFLFRFMGRPAGAAEALSSNTPCDAPIRDVLQRHGLTVDEAACAAPLLVHFGIDRIVGVLEGTVPMDLEMLLAMSGIATECIPDHRRAAVVNLFV